MKKLLLLLIFVSFTLNSNGQTNVQDSLTGFWGINFGNSESKAIEILKSKGLTPTKGMLGGVKELKTLKLEDVDFGNKKALVVHLLFVNDKFYRARVYYNTDSPEIVDDFNSIKKSLEAKYSETKTISQFKSPYEKGDGHEETALKLGYAQLMAGWLFNNNCAILLSTQHVKSGIYLQLQYQDDNLTEEAVNLQSKNNDF